jgi:hypothetical protein
MDFRERLKSVETREDLAWFALALREDFLSNETERENPTVDRFLDAFAARCIDMPGYFLNQGEPQPDQPDWQLVARLPMAASTYE